MSAKHPPSSREAHALLKRPSSSHVHPGKPPVEAAFGRGILVQKREKYEFWKKVVILLPAAGVVP
jgi:hypothetical protein